MTIKKIVVGPFETNCYLIADSRTKEVVIVDPGAEAEKILSTIKKSDLKAKFILLTHEHPDHAGALEFIVEAADIECRSARDGDEIELGNLKIKAMATSGHTPKSFCYFIEDNIFSGDTLFKRGIGRTDLEGGDYNAIKKSLRRLMEFPDNFKVWPGHGEKTTIAEEKKNNPFLTF